MVRKKLRWMADRAIYIAHLIVQSISHIKTSHVCRHMISRHHVLHFQRSALMFWRSENRISVHTPIILFSSWCELQCSGQAKISLNHPLCNQFRRCNDHIADLYLTNRLHEFEIDFDSVRHQFRCLTCNVIDRKSSCSAFMFDIDRIIKSYMWELAIHLLAVTLFILHRGGVFLFS